MNILTIGGTRFVGRAFVELALERGHRLTVFHRGKTGRSLFDDVSRVIGDRDGEIDRLQGEWDVVVDLCGYVPRVVRQSAEYVRPRADRYVFVSTISVYGDLSRPGLAEGDELGTLADPSREEMTGATYGPLKALCEAVVEECFDRSLIVRPGLIVGRYDSTDRFSYYPRRVRLGGSMAAPGGPDRPTQFVDVRDLGRWMLDSIEQGRTGVFNVIRDPLPMGELLDTCRSVTGADVDIRWIDDATLLAHEVRPAVGLPFWLPASDARSTGVYRIDNTAARAAGLQFRSTEDTIRDTLQWLDTLPADHAWRAGLSMDQEKALLGSPPPAHS